MYEDIIKSTAESLGDTLTDKVAKGGHSTVYFGKKYVHKVTEKKVMEKSERIHALISTSSSNKLKSLVPKTILNKDLGQESLVVEELKTGNHPQEISEGLLKETVSALSEVHKIDIKQVLTDFEGEELPNSEYWKNQVESANKYAHKLRSSDLILEDIELIEKCLAVIKNVCSKNNSLPRLALVYKDVHQHNVLVNEDGELSALIDWDSAMSGPVELEYVVLWARFPEMWPLIDPGDLDKDIFVVAGIVQGLRFWKSFTRDSKYVDQQRSALRRLLVLYGT
jgi:serine/threonine protein kinase